jgi:hypothetical protein
METNVRDVAAASLEVETTAPVPVRSGRPSPTPRSLVDLSHARPPAYERGKGGSSEFQPSLPDSVRQVPDMFFLFALAAAR